MTTLTMAILLAGVPEAIAYLEAEVPRWKSENGCYSCHNNGDGARALIAAGRRASAALADTIGFLRDPKAWPADLAALALVQFGTALAALGDNTSAVAARLIKLQKPDGHWEMDAEATVGSPVTYGPVLGTVLARRLVEGEAARRAEAWLRQRRAEHPLDIAALVMAFARPEDVARLTALQAKDGSWNGAEPFDTAIAILALDKLAPEAAAKGRGWLLKTQLAPGGWPGTTRPAGGQSYAQHISTSAWALLALLEVR
jgi:hypothetical protein